MTISEPQWTQILIALAGVGGFLRLRWQRNEDRREKMEDKAAALAEALRHRKEQLEDQEARRREEAEARDRASKERREQTLEIIAKAEAEARAMKILTEATADKLRQEAVTVAQRLLEQNKKDYAASQEVLEKKISEVHEAATLAFKEANHANIKLEAYHEVIIGQQDAAKTKLAADGGKLDKLQETADTIDDKVDTIVGDAAAAGTPSSGKLDKIQATADTIDEKVDTIVKKDDGA